jgi:hypothetical protein
MKQEPPEGRRSTPAARRESPGFGQGRRQLDSDGPVVDQRAVIDRLAREASRDPSVIDAFCGSTSIPARPRGGSRTPQGCPRAHRDRTLRDRLDVRKLIALAEKG